jgi:hypothetical protein
VETQPWNTPQNILVILAHPDDPEFFCGATLAKWAREGHPITYLLLTCGDKGFNPATHPEMTPENLCGIRHEEQQNAAKVIGAQAVHFMDLPDGYLTSSLDLRRDIVREIRRHKPDILVTCDPQNLFAMPTASTIPTIAPADRSYSTPFFPPPATSHISPNCLHRDSSRTCRRKSGAHSPASPTPRLTSPTHGK